MRHWKWLAGLVLAVAFAAPSHAQTTNNSFSGFNPLALFLQQQPISPSQSVVPIAQPQMFNHTFSLANILPSISKFSASPVIGGSQYPMSYQPDLSFFAPFQIRRLAPLNVPY